MTATLLSRRTHTRRKPCQRHCAWCVEPIVPGDRYTIVAHHDGDGFASTYYHEECDKAVGETIRQGTEVGDFWPGAWICWDWPQKRGEVGDDGVWEI